MDYKVKINLISVLISMCRVFSCVVGRGCLLWPVHSLGKSLLAFALLHSIFQGQICLLLKVFLDFLLLHSNPLYEKDISLDVSSEWSCRSSQNRSTSASSALLVGAQTWITVILNGLLWKGTVIILLFMRLHPSTAFRTLLLTMMATPFLLRDSCPQ